MTKTLDSAPVSALFRQLAAAARGGLALQEVGQILTLDQPAVADRHAMPPALLNALARGEALSTAMEASTLPFTTQTVQWVRTAEEQGDLASTLDVLASDFDKQARTTVGLRATLIWPACVAIGMLALMILMSLYVVPTFAETYAGLGVELPLLTRSIFATAHLTASYWWLWMIPLALLLVAYLRGVRTVVAGVETLIGRISFVARVREARFISRLIDMCKALHTNRRLLSAALAHLAATTSRDEWSDATTRLQASLAGSTPLSDALAGETVWPKRLALYVRLGERMGDLATPMAQLSETAESNFRVALFYFERGAMLLIYSLLGICVGMVIAGIYLPIFKLGSAI